MENLIIEETKHEPSDEIKETRKLLAEATERIATLTEENKDKDAKIESLKSDKNKLQSMLNHALNLCKYVKRSWVGKVFFKSQLKQLNEGQEEER